MIKNNEIQKNKGVKTEIEQIKSYIFKAKLRLYKFTLKIILLPGPVEEKKKNSMVYCSKLASNILIHILKPPLFLV